MLPDLARGDHHLEASKQGYEKLEADFSFLNRADVLYLRMTSFAQLLTMAEDALNGRRWAEAEGLLERAGRLDSSDAVLRYLRALLCYRAERFEESAEHLQALLADDVREPYVYLLLADLYERNLGDPEQAAANLASYLELRADPEAEKRLQELQNEETGNEPEP